MSKIVIALGGNALGKTATEQMSLVKNAAKSIVDLVEAGNDVVIAHGNGPQVGMINLAMSVAAQAGAIAADMPFPECGAMSQGYIGYHLQNSIDNELKKRQINRKAVTLITQVLVSKDDPAFKHPTKPIGAFYTKEEAEKIAQEKGYQMVEDAGRGYRQVVPSPKPLDVIEKAAINDLVNAGKIVITVGGGGIPVIEENNQLKGVPAVIDKDFASAKLAELVDADLLVILTAVDQVALNYGTENETHLDKLNLKEAQEYINQGQFAPGSMLPKVEAAMEFAKTGGTAIIASLKNAHQAVKGQSGTIIKQ